MKPVQHIKQMIQDLPVHVLASILGHPFLYGLSMAAAMATKFWHCDRAWTCAFATLAVGSMVLFGIRITVDQKLFQDRMDRLVRSLIRCSQSAASQAQNQVQEIIELVQRETRVERIEVALLDDKASFLHIDDLSFTRGHSLSFSAMRFRLNGPEDQMGIAAVAARSGQTVVVRDTATDPRFLPAKVACSDPDSETRSLVCVPILIRENGARYCVGVVTLGRTRPAAIRPHEVQIAEWMAIALQRFIAGRTPGRLAA